MAVCNFTGESPRVFSLLISLSGQGWRRLSSCSRPAWPSSQFVWERLQQWVINQSSSLREYSLTSQQWSWSPWGGNRSHEIISVMTNGPYLQLMYVPCKPVILAYFDSWCPVLLRIVCLPVVLNHLVRLEFCSIFWVTRAVWRESRCAYFKYIQYKCLWWWALSHLSFCTLSVSVCLCVLIPVCISPQYWNVPFLFSVSVQSPYLLMPGQSSSLNQLPHAAVCLRFQLHETITWLFQ